MAITRVDTTILTVMPEWQMSRRIVRWHGNLAKKSTLQESCSAWSQRLQSHWDHWESLSDSAAAENEAALGLQLPHPQKARWVGSVDMVKCTLPKQKARMTGSCCYLVAWRLWDANKPLTQTKPSVWSKQIARRHWLLRPRGSFQMSLLNLWLHSSRPPALARCSGSKVWASFWGPPLSSN